MTVEVSGFPRRAPGDRVRSRPMLDLVGYVAFAYLGLLAVGDLVVLLSAR